MSKEYYDYSVLRWFKLLCDIFKLVLVFGYV